MGLSRPEVVYPDLYKVVDFVVDMDTEIEDDNLLEVVSEVDFVFGVAFDMIVVEAGIAGIGIVKVDLSIVVGDVRSFAAVMCSDIFAVLDIGIDFG